MASAACLARSLPDPPCQKKKTLQLLSKTANTIGALFAPEEGHGEPGAGMDHTDEPRSASGSVAHLKHEYYNGQGKKGSSSFRIAGRKANKMAGSHG